MASVTAASAVAQITAAAAVAQFKATDATTAEAEGVPPPTDHFRAAADVT